jgi:hypothetical protein
VSERSGRRGLPEEPVSSSLSEVRALLREAHDTDGAAQRLRPAGLSAPSHDAQAVGTELQEVLSCAPTAAELEAERRARWSEASPTAPPPKSSVRRWVISAFAMVAVGAGGAVAFWPHPQPMPEPSAPTSQVQAPERATTPAPRSAAISVAPSGVAAAPPSVAAPARSEAPPAPKATKKRPQRRNVDRQFDDVLDRL